MAHVEVEPGQASHTYTDGYSWKRKGNDPTAPSRVLIQLGGTDFPKYTLYRKAAGSVTVHTWQEEFLLVLAHEMRHIDQFWSDSPPVHYEVDAERFAQEVLAAWRSRHQIRRAA